MLSFLKTKKSAGVRVTPAVHRLITRANNARDDGLWNDAADLYRQALKADPSLTHIWVQVGHAEKNRGRLDEAEAAYVRATLLAPHAADPQLQLGHLRKMQRDVSGATISYLRAARIDPKNANALEELQRMIQRFAVASRPDLTALLRTNIFDARDAASPPEMAAKQGAILFDVSSIIEVVLSGRSPAAAGLVGQDIVPALISRLAPPTAMCAHIVGHGRWIRVTTSQFATVLALGRRAGEKPISRRQQINDLILSFVLSPRLDMPEAATLIDLDAQYAPIDHALFVRDARSGGKARYAASGSCLDPALDAEIDFRISARDAEGLLETIQQISSRHDITARGQAAAEAELARLQSLSDTGTGLAFRTGIGWLPPEHWGSWIGVAGGELELRLPTTRDVRIYLRLKGLPSGMTRYQLALTDGREIQGEIDAGDDKWVMIDDLPIEHDILRIRISGQDSQPVEIERLGRTLPASVGVAGFYLCERDDREARLAVIEAGMLSDFEILR